MTSLVFMIVVFFGDDLTGVLLPKEFTSLNECHAVARPIAMVAARSGQAARGVCVAKNIKVSL